MYQIIDSIGNPTAILIERIFWLVLGGFLFLTIITSLIRGIKVNKNQIKISSSSQLENLAKKAIQQNSDIKWKLLSVIFIFLIIITHTQWCKNRTTASRWSKIKHLCLMYQNYKNEISSCNLSCCRNFLWGFYNCNYTYNLIILLIEYSDLTQNSVFWR